MKRTRRFPFLVLPPALIACVMVLTWAQGGNSNQQPAGGGTTSEAATANGSATKKAAKPKAPANVSKPSTTAAKSQSGTAEKIDGKWWTSGNDFGKSAVVFIQAGNNVSGQISYADGRTGNLTGVFGGKRLNYSWTNSAGDHGTGWLEQSWTNFLGGPWRGQKVTNGSWTLNRIEGNWCFGGSLSRIRKVTHDVEGNLRYSTEDGDLGGGHLDGPYIFLDDDSESLKGTMFYKANRIDFANGAYWTWCGR
jgi:hypothetical protein